MTRGNEFPLVLLKSIYNSTFDAIPLLTSALSFDDSRTTLLFAPEQLKQVLSYAVNGKNRLEITLQTKRHFLDRSNLRGSEGNKSSVRDNGELIGNITFTILLGCAQEKLPAGSIHRSPHATVISE